MNLDKERMVDLREYIPFHHHPFDLVLLLDILLLHGLDGEELPGVLPSHQYDLGVGTLPNH